VCEVCIRVCQGRNWGAQGTQISGTPGGHRGCAPGDKPWEVALGGVPIGGGKDGKGHPEITPLEVCSHFVIALIMHLPQSHAEASQHHSDDAETFFMPAYWPA
jgi:hypothetical protein